MRTLTAAAIFVMASILFDSCVFGTGAEISKRSDCLFGDIGTITLKGSPKPMTCSEFLTPERKTKCYRDDIGEYCCESCKKLENAKTPACLYGDRITLTHKSTKKILTCTQFIAKEGKINCYSTKTKDGCCETCEKNKDASKPVLDYGATCVAIDENLDNVIVVTDGQPSGEKKILQIARNPCEFGDKSKDCIKYSRARICPSPAYAAICCDYCSGWRGKRSTNLASVDGEVQVQALFGNLAQFGDYGLIEEA